LSDGHPIVQALAHPLERYAPLRGSLQPTEILEEVVGADATKVTVSELRDELRLVWNCKLGVPVEHYAQQRRSRAANAENEEGGASGRRAHQISGLVQKLGNFALDGTGQTGKPD
jgi:hypothetical protein